MKRFALIVILISYISMAFAQKDDLSKWSFTAEYGINTLDRDGDSSIQPAYGASVEYAFFPFAGLSLDFYHFPLSGSNFSTNLNASDLNITVNFSRLFFSKFINKVILNGYLGVGLADYTTNYHSQSPPLSVSKNVVTSIIPVGALSVEYYIIKTLALGAKVQFRPFSKDNLEGDPNFNYNGVYNDNLLAITVYLRLKLYSAN